MRQTVLLAAFCLGLALYPMALAIDQAPADSAAPAKSPPVLSPAEEAKTFQLPAGYHMELVLSEPEIKEPVVTVFDGNGRMYVGEMRTYMQDIDATGELNPINRVSRHESTRGDGVYDKHTVFVDKIMPPREILPLLDRVLINETNSSDIYAYYDTKGDGVADKKELFYKGGPRGGNIEHQPSGLVWGLDNWIYQAVSDLRLRYTGGVVQEGHTPSNGGQWGLAQDDYGKMWVTNAGAERGPWKYQTPIIYGGFDLPNDRSPDFQEVWPLVGLADVQGGVSRFRPEDGTLNHTTSSAGITVYRGDRLPADLEGDVLFDEPVGRLIRRAKVENKDGLTYLRNAYDKSEFIRSTDPYFRPVNITTGPDGCLYITDMYRGIIQEAAWVNEGSYLRTVVKKYGFQNVTDHGRIWRLVHDGYTPGPAPHMLDETPAQLVSHLDHPNGWWRDQAQMLLVLHGDKSVVPALMEMARSDKSPLGQIHAIWTLEGLGALDASLIREKLKDKVPQVRIAAMRASESLVQKGDTSLNADLRSMVKDKDPNVVLQTLLTAKLLNWPDYRQFIQLTLAASSSDGVKEIGAQALNEGHTIDESHFNKTDVVELRKGEKIYQELCYACHGYDGNGMPMSGAAPGATQAPPLAHAKEVTQYRDTIVHILLNGLSGPVGGKQYVAQMVPMDTNADKWIAEVSSYVRNSFGNQGGMIHPEDVARLRPSAKLRGKPWTIAELRSTYPPTVPNAGDWKLTASINSKEARLAADGDSTTRWTSNAQLAPGMWIEIQLPQAAMIGGVVIDCTGSASDYARAYKIELSNDGKAWGKPVAQGKGSPGVMQITFPGAKAKFIRITQTGAVAPGRSPFWSIHELELLQPGGTVQREVQSRAN
jgi:mono/diheme cytochrome c family protein/glucose/arabinose dehydrogenase